MKIKTERESYSVDTVVTPCLVCFILRLHKQQAQTLMKFCPQPKLAQLNLDYLQFKLVNERGSTSSFLSSKGRKSDRVARLRAPTRKDRGGRGPPPPAQPLERQFCLGYKIAPSRFKTTYRSVLTFEEKKQSMVKSKETVGNCWTVLKVILGHKYHHKDTIIT